MPPDLSPVRAAHFRRHPLLWMALNHFLSADLLRELYAVLVDEVSQGRLALSDVVEEQLTEGASSLRTWTIRPRPGADPVAGYLQQLAQVMLWAGDQSASANPGGGDPHLRRWAEDLGLAQRLATTGLDVDLPETAGWPEGLQPLATSIHELRAPGDAGIDVPAIAEGVARAVEAPLSGVLVKHLGDLCAAQDAWAEANHFYALSRPASAGGQDGAWDAFNADFDDIVHQSIAAGCWALSGPDTAVVVLEEPFETATLSTRPLLLVNAKQDEMVARFSDRKGIDFAPDDRPVARAAPLLANSQDVSRAWHAWMQRRFDTAERFFNAALRRQIALGSVTAARETSRQPSLTSASWNSADHGSATWTDAHRGQPSCRCQGLCRSSSRLTCFNPVPSGAAWRRTTMAYGSGWRPAGPMSQCGLRIAPSHCWPGS